MTGHVVPLYRLNLSDLALGACVTSLDHGSP
jgi:hypothetical protein